MMAAVTVSMHQRWLHVSELQLTLGKLTNKNDNVSLLERLVTAMI